MRRTLLLVLLVLACRGERGFAAVPGILNFQGRVTANGLPFTGTGKFKFALVDAAGTTTYWSNDGSAPDGSEPASSVSIQVDKGLYSVLIGDTSLPHMTQPIVPAVLRADGIHLRVWFDDGTNGSQRLAPDQRLAAVAFAMVATSVSDGAITAEKLAPALAARLVPQAGATLVSSEARDAALIGQGFRRFLSVPAAPWVSPDAAGAPSPRVLHAGAWTDRGFAVWGGQTTAAGGGIPAAFSGNGAVYRTDLDRWESLPSLGAPDGRRSHALVWSGQELIVWGGFAAGGYLNDGSRFSFGNQAWTTTDDTSAPVARAGMVAVWTGRAMLIWGGRNLSGYLGDGALYYPDANSWVPLALPGAPTARSGAAFAWCVESLVVWGGENSGGNLGTGGRLAIDASGVPTNWLPLATNGAPSARSGHSAVWTGSRFIVWGGRAAGMPQGDGAAYEPSSNVWTPLSAVGAPSPRSGHVSVWTGDEMLVVGGDSVAGPVADGAAYNPVTDKWRSLTAYGNPVARSGADAVWTGSEVLVFGGKAGDIPVASLQRLDPQPPWYLYRSP